MPDIAEQIRTEWEALKVSNDARLEEVRKNGVALAETQAKVDAINARISELQDQLSANLTTIENRLNRPQLGGGAFEPVTTAQARVYINWWSAKHNVEADDVNLDDVLPKIKDYQRAYRAYLRRGPDGVGPEIMNLMQEGSDPHGGYWVEPDTNGRMVSLIYETSPMRQYASVTTISTDRLEGTYDLEEATLGGWVSELGARTGDTTTPTIGQWAIDVHEHFAEPHATQRLLDDASIDVEAWLTDKLGRRFARVENAAFVNGDGVGKPRGFMTYAAGTPSSTTWAVIQQVASGAAATLTADGLINLVYSLKPAYRDGAIMAMNRTTEAVARTLTDGNGSYIWLPDFSGPMSARMLGVPVVDFPDMPDIAAGAEPIAYANFREAYQIVDRQGTRVLRDPYTTRGRVKFYATRRVGGDVINFDAIKLQTVAAS